MKLFPSTNSSDGKVNQFIEDICSRGESIDVILHQSSTLFRFEKLLIQRQRRFTIETNDTTEILASKLIEKLTSNVSTGLYVFDVQGKVNKKAIVPILLHKILPMCGRRVSFKYGRRKQSIDAPGNKSVDRCL